MGRPEVVERAVPHGLFLAPVERTEVAGLRFPEAEHHEFGFNVIRRPTSNPYSDQNFDVAAG